MKNEATEESSFSGSDGKSTGKIARFGTENRGGGVGEKTVVGCRGDVSGSANSDWICHHVTGLGVVPGGKWLNLLVWAPVV